MDRVGLDISTFLVEQKQKLQREKEEIKTKIQSTGDKVHEVLLNESCVSSHSKSSASSKSSERSNQELPQPDESTNPFKFYDQFSKNLKNDIPRNCDAASAPGSSENVTPDLHAIIPDKENTADNKQQLNLEVNKTYSLRSLFSFLPIFLQQFSLHNIPISSLLLLVAESRFNIIFFDESKFLNNVSN